MKHSNGFESPLTQPYRPPRTENLHNKHDDYAQEAFLRLLQTKDGHALLERILYAPDDESMSYFLRAYITARADDVRRRMRLKRSGVTERLGEQEVEDIIDAFTEIEAADELAYVLREYDCPELHRFLRAYRLRERGSRVPQQLLNQLVKDRRTSGLALQLR